MSNDRTHASSGCARFNERLAHRALERGSGFVLHRPVHVYLQIASACNLDCYMCSEHNRPVDQRHGRGLKCMSLELFGRIEREVLPWSSRISLGVGGEPTIAEHFVEFVRRAARAGLEIHLTTNGTRLEHGDIAHVIANEVAYLFVSMDAATPATYERIRRGSRWDKMRRGLLKLKEERRAAGTRACDFTLCFVLMRSNVDELCAFVELAHEIGADAVHAQHVIPVTEEGKLESLIEQPERYNAMRAAAEVRATELGIRFDAPRPYPVAGMAEPAFAEPDPARPGPCAAHDIPIEATPEPTSSAESAAKDIPTAVLELIQPSPASPLDGYAVGCSMPSQSVYVFYDGRVFPCCHPYSHQKMQMGDLRTQSFGEIWNGRDYRNLRAGMRTGDVPSICTNCSSAHDPPRVYEDPDQVLAGPSLAEHYAERDLDPLDGRDPLTLLETSGLAGYAQDLQRHADALEEERAHLVGHIANLEAERPHLVGHIANLERERAKPWLRRAPLVRWLARVVQNPRSER